MICVVLVILAYLAGGLHYGGKTLTGWLLGVRGGHDARRLVSRSASQSSKGESK